MTHPIIKTDNYILITSDEEIKGGDYFYKSSFNRPARNGIIEMAGSFDKKIIAHLPLNNAPQLEGVPLLPPLPNEDDVEKLVSSLSQPKLPVGFKCETISLKQLPFNVEMSVDEINKPKIFKGVMQGEWIFE